MDCQRGVKKRSGSMTGLGGRMLVQGVSQNGAGAGLIYSVSWKNGDNKENSINLDIKDNSEINHALPG